MYYCTDPPGAERHEMVQSEREKLEKKKTVSRLYCRLLICAMDTGHTSSRSDYLIFYSLLSSCLVSYFRSSFVFPPRVLRLETLLFSYALEAA